MWVTILGKWAKLITELKNKLRDEASKHRYYKTYWRTHQMSDQLPMWIEFKTDFAEEYLRKKWVDKDQAANISFEVNEQAVAKCRPFCQQWRKL